MIILITWPKPSRKKGLVGRTSREVFSLNIEDGIPIPEKERLFHENEYCL
jgi:hypothetical protein